MDIYIARFIAAAFLSVTTGPAVDEGIDTGSTGI